MKIYKYEFIKVKRDMNVKSILFDKVSREDIRLGKKKITIMKDGLFKAFFNNSDNLKPGARFIAILTGRPYEEILANLRLESNELKKMEVYDKASRVDYIAKIDNEFFQIEINNNQYIDCIERNEMYGYRIVTSNSEGSKLGYVGNIIQVNIDNFALEGHTNTVDVIVQSFNGYSNEVYSDKVIIVHIYLPLIMEKYYNNGELDDLEKIVLAFALQDMDKASGIWREKFMKDLLEEQLHVSNTDNVYIPYDHESETLKMEKAMAVEEGFKQGIEEGIQRGIQRGMEQGIEQGIEQETKKIVKTMYENKMDLNMISKYLDLSVDKIKKILDIK